MAIKKLLAGIKLQQLRSVSKLHANTSGPDVFEGSRVRAGGSLELCHRSPDNVRGPGALISQSRDPINYGEVRNSKSLTARTVESFDHQEKYFSPYRRTITSYFKYISIADLCSDLWLDKKISFCSLGNKKIQEKR